MFQIILFLSKLIFNSTSQSKKELALKVIILKKEVSILKRRLELNNRRVKFNSKEKITFALSSKLSSSKKLFSIIKPETVLNWYKKLIKKRWTFETTRKIGRPPIPSAVKQLVLKMKNSNILWGNRRISGELKKLNIEACHETVRKIITFYRKEGKVKKSHTWSTFIKSHINSLFAMDCFTVDSILGKRFFVLVILEIKTRKIIQFGITEHPVKEFVRQQIIEFSNNISGMKHLIHDRAPEFCSIDYTQYDIEAVKTSVKSPSMNSYIERVIGTIQREAIDWFIILNRRQLYNILKEYVYYYNNYRPHQGIGKIPVNNLNKGNGKIQKKPILNGLHNHYFRAA